MCGGPSSTQSELQSEEASFYQNQISAYNKAYSQFSDITDTLNKQFLPILQAGPGQMGYTPAELSDLNTMASSGTAAAYNAAMKALGQQQATMGGGTSPVNATSGPAMGQRERLAALSASQQASQRLQIQQSGYETGRQMYGAAVGGEQSLAGMWNPNTFAGSTVNAGNLASTEANTIAQQQQSAWGSVLGALGGVAGAALGNPAGIAGMFRPGGGGGGGGSAIYNSPGGAYAEPLSYTMPANYSIG